MLRRVCAVQIEPRNHELDHSNRPHLARQQDDIICPTETNTQETQIHIETHRHTGNDKRQSSRATNGPANDGAAIIAPRKRRRSSP